MSSENGNLSFVLEVGTRVTEERKRLGIKQQELADRCGVSRVAIGKYERGLNIPGGGVLGVWCELGMDVPYILTGKRINNSFSAAGSVANPRLSELSEAQQQMVNQLIDELADGNKQTGVVQRLAKEINELSRR